VHDNYEEAVESHIVLAGVLLQCTKESQQGPTALLGETVALSFLCSLLWYILPAFSVNNVVAARAWLLAVSAISFASDQTQHNVTPTPTTTSHAVPP